MAEDDLNMAILIGEIRGELRGISNRLDHADISRSAMHGRMNEMAGDVSGMKRDITEIKKEMAEEIVPEVSLVKNLKAKAWGAAIVLGAMGAVMWWVLSQFGQAIWALLTGK